MNGLASLFSLSDFGLKGRASAMHYRTMVGRVNLWALLFTCFSLVVLHFMHFPLYEVFTAIKHDDEALLKGIADMIRPTEVAIFLITALVMVYLFILSMAALIMRLHDFDRAGWWVIAVLIVPGIIDGFVIDIMNATQISWFTMAMSLFMLFKAGDMGKNAHGYTQEPEQGWPIALKLVSILPVIFILADVVITVTIGR